MRCSFAAEPGDNLNQFPFILPRDVLEFWQIARHAALFKDEEYGQWGVEVLEPAQALAETAHQAATRPRDFAGSDLVVARFFGDSDLVLIACNPSASDFGSVTIALPIDKRCDWPTVAKSFGEFLSRLVEAEGDKYWEV